LVFYPYVYLLARNAFLAQDKDRFRLPYAAADSEFSRRTVFYGSVNGGAFLQDRTGNTRFWVIPAVGMNTDHGLDMQQVWAQVLTLWRGGEVHWMTRAEMEQVNENNEHHTPEDPIRDKLLRGFDWDAFNVDKPALYMTATHVCEELNIKETMNARVGEILKELTGREAKPARPGGGGKPMRLHGLPPAVGPSKGFPRLGRLRLDAVTDAVTCPLL